MNNNQLFDEHIKEQMGGYSPQVHPRIWEKIIAEKEKRKPAGFWFTLLQKRNLLIIAGLLFAGGAGIYLLISNYSTGTKNTEIAATGKNDIETNNNKNITGNNPDHKVETGVSNINTTGFSPGLNNIAGLYFFK